MQTIARLNDPSLFTDRCLVGGKWIAAETSSAIEVANPVTGEIIGNVPNCRRTETDQAIAAGARVSRLVGIPAGHRPRLCAHAERPGAPAQLAHRRVRRPALWILALG